jgi:hypothetical protein
MCKAFEKTNIGNVFKKNKSRYTVRGLRIIKKISQYFHNKSEGISAEALS